MGNLGDGDARTGKTANLGNLGSTTATICELDPLFHLHDASHHVAGDRDVLGPHVWVVDSRRGLAGPPGLPSSEGDRGLSAASPVTKSAGSTEAVGNRSPPDTASRSSNSLGTKSTSEDTCVTSSSRVVLDGTLSPLPVLEKALGNLVNGSLDSLDSTLNFDDTLGRLREHLLGGDHASSRHVLDLLDLETRAANDGSHEVVADQQTDRGERVGWRRGKGRVGKGGLEEETSDFGVGAGDGIEVTADAEDTVLNTLHDLGNARFAAGEGSDLSDG
jgi:hypothetical protein